MKKVLLLLFLSPFAWATSYTSNATGAWQSSTTWSPQGVPGGNDTVTLASGYTITVSSISSATVAGITCDSPTGTGILVVNGLLDYKGTVNECSGNPWVLNAGASIIADSTTANVPWNIGYANCDSAPCAQLQMNGTSTAPVTVGIAAGSLNSGGFGSGAHNDTGAMLATWTNFNNCGTSSIPCVDEYTWYYVGLNTTITYSSFTSCGLVEVGTAYANNTTFIFNNNTIVNPLESGGHGLEVSTNGGETFTCQIKNNYLEGTTKEVFGSGSYYGTDDGCIVNGNVFVGSTTFIPYDGSTVGHGFCNPLSATGYSGCHFDGNLFFNQLPASGISSPGGSITRSVFLAANNASGSAHLYGAGSLYNADLNGLTIEREYNDVAGWEGTSVFWYMQVFSTTKTYSIENALILPAPNGYASMQMSTLASTQCDGSTSFCPVLTSTHNTTMGITTGFAVYGGEENNGAPTLYKTITDNIFWLPPTHAGSACDTGWVAGNTPVNGTFGTVNHNDVWGITASNYTSGYCGASSWYGSTPGVNDLAQNPQFLDSTRNFTNWGINQGVSVSSWTSIVNAFKCMNAPAQSGCLMNNASILNYYYWVRRGYTPQNSALHNAASDGLDIGAIPYLSTNPPQFVGLLTSTTDITGDPNFVTPSTPTTGGCYTDPLLGNTSCRPPAITGSCPVNSITNPTGDCSITNRQTQSDYAKTVPWSVDNNYYIEFNNGWLELFSRPSTNTYTFIRTIRTFSSSYGANRDYGSGDSSFGASLWGDGSNWLWANNASSNPDTIYYTGSSISNSNAFQLKAYNVVTDSLTIVHDFTPTINLVNSWGTCGRTASTIDMAREGNQSDDDRYWAFGVTDGSDSGWCAAIVYDKTLDTVVAISSFGAGGMCGQYSCANTAYQTLGVTLLTAGSGQSSGTYTVNGVGGNCTIAPYFVVSIASFGATMGQVTLGNVYGYCAPLSTPTFSFNEGGTPATFSYSWSSSPYPNWIGMSPSGKYVIINWQGAMNDPAWSRGVGTEIYTSSLTWLGVASAENGHGDVGYDVNGLEVYVDGDSDVTAYGKSAFEICALDTINPNAGNVGCRRYLTVPCTWGAATCPYSGSRANTYFISMRGTHGAGLGQMMLSTQADGGPGFGSPAGNGGWGALENDAVLIDWSAGSMNAEVAVPTQTVVTRISRNHGIFTYDISGDDDYGSQANTAVDRTFTKASWTSNLDQVPQAICSTITPPGSAACNYYNFYTELGSTGTTPSSPQIPFSGQCLGSTTFRGSVTFK